MSQINLTLASNSPRRKELLSQLGYQFDCAGSDIDETPHQGESPIDYVKRMAVEKAQAQNSKPATLVLGSDTCVIYQNEILGKPRDFEDARRMLMMLSGEQHQVLTSIAVVSEQAVEVEVVTTQVRFKTLSNKEIVNYWRSGEPKDKAGSYGIQGIGGQFVCHIEGSYSAVVGLPLYETAQLLARHGCLSQVMQEEGAQ